MIKKFFFRPRSIPLAFLFLCLLAYGLLIPWLGFYWDDWPYTWFSHTLGPLGLLKALAEDRPFLAGIYMVSTTLFGRYPIAWQLFAIFTRWLSVVAFWWTLRQIWPGHLRQVTWAALLFAVYPGFLQHWISVIYSQAYLLFAAFLFSLGLMISAVRAGFRTRRYWAATAAALLLSAFSFFSTEYFFGVELIRPFLIWLALRELAGEPRKRAAATLKHYIPYFIELMIYAVWRGFLFRASTYEVEALNELSSGVGGTLVNLIQTLITNGWTAGWAAWAQAFNAPNLWDLSIRTTQLTWLVVLATLGLAVVYLLRMRYARADEEEPAGTDARWAVEALAIGLLALLASSLPFWAAGLPLNLLFPFNRFTLAMMFGACLALAGLLEWLVRTYRQKVALLALLLAFAVGLQFQTANTFRREWDAMRAFFWQVTWRMPGIRPSTLLLTHEIPFKYYSDNSLSAPLNWIYAPDNHSQEMPYILDYLKIRLANTLPGLEAGLPVKQHFRALTFTGNMSDAIVFTYRPPGCLRVLDPVYSNGETFPDMHELLAAAAKLSNFDRILPDANPPVQPPASLFGRESRNTWCYYFEKAELARQTGDWAEVNRLGEEAYQNRKSPEDMSEWLTFIEGYAHTGAWQKAATISSTVYQTTPALQPALCQTWGRIEQQANPGAEEKTLIQNLRKEFLCSPIQPQAQP